jgi:hypothetical protein
VTVYPTEDGGLARLARIARQNPTLPRLPRPHREPKLSGGLVVRLERIVGVTSAGVLDDPFVFQVPPINVFPINRSYPKPTYDTVGNVQMGRKGVVQLRTISYQTLFCDDPWNWTLLHADGYVPDPLAMLEELDEIGRAQEPFWLTARNPRFRDGYDVNWAAWLTDLNSEIRDGEPDARYVTVGFTEFRDASLKTRQLPGGGGRAARLPVTLRADQLPSNRNTLYELATFYYGTASEWRRIAKANGLTKRNPSSDLRGLGHRKITVPRRP